ncbi:acetyl-CoA carboxylase biotin carboxylase subunit family protein [Kitasatospora sp. NPDC058201]|uniref:ATP-grasp domain-containing protein n=1 Tax=unclassified Kitasatospora TaxID=2633591 RepID=UPI0036460812
MLIVGPTKDHEADLRSVAETHLITLREPVTDSGLPTGPDPDAEPPAGVLALTAEALAAAADLAEALNVPGPSKASAIASADRSVARVLLTEAGLPTPRGTRVDSHQQAAEAAQWTGFPVIMRPLGNLGHFGAIRADGPQDLHAAWTYAHAASLASEVEPGAVMVEQAPDGDWITLQTATTSDGTWVAAAVRTALTGHPMLQPASHLVTADDVDSELAVLATRAIEALGVEQGVGHVHIVLTLSGPVIVDACAHIQGDSVPELVRLATGVDLVLAAVRTAAGLDPAITPTHRASAAAAAIRAPRAGTVAGLHVAPDLLDQPWLARLTWGTRLGATVEAQPAPALARCIVTGPDPDTCLDRLAQVRQDIDVSIEPRHP